MKRQTYWVLIFLLVSMLLITLVSCSDSSSERKRKQHHDDHDDDDHDDDHHDDDDDDDHHDDEHDDKKNNAKKDEDTSKHDGFMKKVKERGAQKLDIAMDFGFFHAFFATLAMVIVSELGDKTFFIAAIMAMRHSRATVFLAAICALALMTVLSALLGFATTVIPRKFTHAVASILFAVFGVKMIREGWNMAADEGIEEYEEVQEDLKKRDEEYERRNVSVQDIESGIIRNPPRRLLHGVVSAIFIQAFTLTFLAEWGDRSQITTIVLAAREEVVGVILGGTLGHALCTGLAVLGGRMVAQKISVRTVTLIGGVAFLIFAFSSFFVGAD